MLDASATFNVMCPVCKGSGRAPAPTLYVSADGTGGTAYTTKHCRACDGDGWLPSNGRPSSDKMADDSDDPDEAR